MSDIARLGVSMDSSEIKQGIAALSDLTNAAARAEAAMDALGKSKGAAAMALKAAQAVYDQSKASLAAARASEVATQADIEAASAARQKAQAALLAAKADHSREAAAYAAAKAVNDEAQAALAAANATARLRGAVNDNAAAAKTGSYHAANLAAQFQDVAVTAAMGMNPLQIALQQGTQMAMVFSAMAAEGGKNASTLSLLSSAFATVLSPAALLIISITALVAGLLQLVDWTELAQVALRGLANILPTIAPYAAAAAAGLALLYAPTIIAGVTGVVAAISRLVVSLGTLAVVAAAANPFAALVLGMAVAAAAAVAFQDDLARIFGVDMVAAAKTGINYIIGAFVAAYGDIKFLWAQFPAMMGAAAIGAANAALGAMERMINAASGLLNSFIARANQALSNLPGGLQLGEIGNVNFGQIANPYASGVDAAGRARAAQQQGELNRDYLGQIGGAIGKGASAAAAKLKEWAAGLDDVEKKSKKAGKTEADKYAEIIAGADRRIASLQAETMALGLTEEASARMRYEQDLLNQASQKDITLSAAQRAELAAKAGEMAKWEVAAKRVKDTYDSIRDGLKGFISDLRTGLQNGESFWKAFGNAASNVLDKIISKIEDQLVDALMSAFGGGRSGGVGGLLGSIFGIGGSGALPGGIGLYAQGGLVHAAGGGRITGPGTATSDSIPAMLSRGEFVVNAASAKAWGPFLEAINDNRMSRMAAGGYVNAPTMRASGYDGRGAAAQRDSAPVQQHVTMKLDVNLKGANGDAAIQSAVMQGIQGAMVVMRQQVPGLAVQAVGDNARRRG